ncbi:MAG: EF-hand domain-containing protein [Candidatus Hydrogenedentes bacterium]|nr:EF-hand domain-containing protein [Candidatus Hydrogenedentota bacterium]
MKKLLAFCVLAVVVLALCSPALGQEVKQKARPNPGMGMQKADANKDGKVSFEEISAAFPNMTQEKFDRMDRDKDGALTAGEMASPGGPQAGQILQRADANKDGAVTLDEAQAALPKMTEERFKQFDTNGDGAITKEDAPPVRSRIPEGAGADLQSRMKAIEDRFVRGDANGDGKVTLEEFMATPGATEEKFKRNDRNGDGVLSRDDIRVPGRPVPPAQPKTLDPAQLDKNGDGKLSYEEGTAFFPPLLREAFDRLDANKDGFVTMDEVARPGA